MANLKEFFLQYFFLDFLIFFSIENSGSVLPKNIIKNRCPIKVLENVENLTNVESLKNVENLTNVENLKKKRKSIVKFEKTGKRSKFFDFGDHL